MVLINELNGEMARKNMTRKKLAELIGISERTLANRFKTGIFKSNEMEKIIQILDLKNPEKIFFANEVT